MLECKVGTIVPVYMKDGKVLYCKDLSSTLTLKCVGDRDAMGSGDGRCVIDCGDGKTVDYVDENSKCE